MRLQEIITSHLRRETKDEDSIQLQKVNFPSTKCIFEIAFRGLHDPTPSQRHIYEGDLREFDPEGIQYLRSSSGPVLILWSRYLRPVVDYTFWSSREGYVPRKKKNNLYFFVRGSMPRKDKGDLKRALKEYALSGLPDSLSSLDTGALKAEIASHAAEVARLTNGLDFSIHNGTGVREQEMRISDDGLHLVFHQHRAFSRDCAGTYLDAMIPLWTLDPEPYVDRDRAESGRGLPCINIHAVDALWNLKFRFSGPPPFDHESKWESIYCQSIPDCERLQVILRTLIPVSRDLAYLLNS